MKWNWVEKNTFSVSQKSLWKACSSDFRWPTADRKERKKISNLNWGAKVTYLKKRKLGFIKHVYIYTRICYVFFFILRQCCFDVKFLCVIPNIGWISEFFFSSDFSFVFSVYWFRIRVQQEKKKCDDYICLHFFGRCDIWLECWKRNLQRISSVFRINPC